MSKDNEEEEKLQLEAQVLLEEMHMPFFNAFFFAHSPSIFHVQAEHMDVLYWS